MKYLKIPYYLITLFLCCFSFNYCIGQKNEFSKDSLRIKIYTKIEYVEGLLKKITVTKVFCDYCSPGQIEALKEQARELAFYERRYSNKGKVNEIQKYTMIIRVSKKDLIAIKDAENKEGN